MKVLWSCGHTANSVCAECHAELIQKANKLQAEVDNLKVALSNLRDVVAETAAHLSNVIHADEDDV